MWFGDNVRQGIAVLASPSYTLTRLPALPDVPKFVFPVLVSGPRTFLLMVVWSKGSQAFPYVEGVVRAVRMYRSEIESKTTVLVGDLNSNVIWDHEHPRDLNHSALVSLLAELGLVSAYHSYFDEAQGQETRATYFFHWKQERAFHIDYCFIPNTWAAHVERVEVGSYESWKTLSDHRPLLVELAHSAG